MSTRSLSTRKLTAANYNSLGKTVFVTSGLGQYFDAAKTNASGSSWTDLQGTGNMTLVSSPTIATGSDASSNYVTFNGSTQYGSGLTSMTNKAAFTVYLWMKTTSTADASLYYDKPAIFGVNTTGATSRDYVISMNNGYIGCWSGLGSDGTNQPSTTKINDGNWFEIVLTSSFANGTRLYCNQTQIGSSLTASQNTNSTYAPYIAGANGNYALTPAAISVAVLATYDRELSTTELAANWSYFKGRYGR